MNKCDWCNLIFFQSYSGYENYDFENPLSDKLYVNLDIVFDSKSKRYGIAASGDESFFTQINYCPKCGRKLF